MFYKRLTIWLFIHSRLLFDHVVGFKKNPPTKKIKNLMEGIFNNEY